LADAFNEQNKKGMDLDGNLGGDIFNIPAVNGFAYADNTGSATVSATVEAGKGNEIPATDFRVTFTSATTVEIAAVDSKGNVIGTPSTANVTAGVIDSSTITSGESFGLEMNVSGAANTGDSFLVKMNSTAASTIELATQRPESLALASPIRTLTEAGNTSDAKISVGSVSNTGTGSNFTAVPPSLTQGDITLTKTGNANEYQIQDGNGTTTFTITPPADNILAQAGAPYDVYGFDFNIEGNAAVGDVFTIEFNTGGFDDNRNGLELSKLPTQELVRQNVVTTASADNHKTFNEAYAGLVTEIGVIANQAKTNGAAFDALAAQSEAWFESLSGVNLDEEAASLLRFQQAYSASAQIISTARTVFDTLLSAAR
jgi:flagellar hook-associated protein 1 FlgK